MQNKNEIYEKIPDFIIDNRKVNNVSHSDT